LRELETWMKALFCVTLQKHGKLEIENTLLVQKLSGKPSSKELYWLSVKFCFPRHHASLSSSIETAGKLSSFFYYYLYINACPAAGHGCCFLSRSGTANERYSLPSFGNRTGKEPTVINYGSKLFQNILTSPVRDGFTSKLWRSMCWARASQWIGSTYKLKAFVSYQSGGFKFRLNKADWHAWLRDVRNLPLRGFRETKLMQS